MNNNRIVVNVRLFATEVLKAVETISFRLFATEVLKAVETISFIRNQMVELEPIAAYSQSGTCAHLADMGGLAPYYDDSPHASATLASAPGTVG